ncbi:protein translocase subunit SecD [Thalassoroseus pseudoceratinae]|uniref:protein translocase subunit SecD n=1 Tax=Thalassoroseus pseudoceratinae TaxID=2713176 RepID=UPI00141F4C45|nr:protein translocase subunit SecD [Thalassoroseus pseudoceratinae]
MSERTVRTRQSAATRLRYCGLVIVLIGLFGGSSGCGKPSPIPALRDLGAEVKINRDERRRITMVRFPAGADDAALEPITQIGDTSMLTDIDLSQTAITDEGLKSLAGLKNLQVLNLDGTQVTDAALPELAKHPKLRELSIADTSITDEGLLEHIGDFESLTILDIARPGKPEKPEPHTMLSALDFGIDLAGGTNLIYQVDRVALQEKIQEELDQAGDEAAVTRGQIEERISGDVMDQMVGAVSRRLNPSGVEEITVRRVGSDRIEVIIPKADRETIERKKAEMTRLGSLEFAILGTSFNPEHEKFYEQITEQGTDDLYIEGELRASWRSVGVGKDGRPKPVSFDDNSDQYPVYSDSQGRALVIFERKNDRVTGEYLRNASPTTDENGRLAVSFQFYPQGATRFSRLTANHQGGEQRKYRLSILLDGLIHSAPSINSVISSQGQITGRFTREEVDELVNVLNAGALAVPILKDPISEQTVSPLLGEEVRRKGIMAIGIAGAAVFVFMLLYYRFAGVVANTCLLLNILLVIGTMAMIDATFTLPGLAGIVLTIGMAVDANVLIFERMREERTRGSSPRMAIQNGFGRAFTAIVDANMTTLIVAVVLYMIGTDQVRGFAVTLFIGIIMSMFTALYFGRLVFDLCERKRWIKEPIGKSFLTPPHLDFIGKRRIAFVVSIVLIVAGMSTLFMRGSDNLDIDFSGGTMLTFELTEPQEFSDVKAALQAGFEDETITVEKLSDIGEDTGSEKGRMFRVRSKKPDTEVVEDEVRSILKEQNYQLQTVAATVGEIQAGKEDAEEEATDSFRGHRVPVTFNPPIAESRIRQAFENALGELSQPIPDSDKTEPVYERPESLFKIVDLEESSEVQEGEDGSAQTETVYASATIQVVPVVERENLDKAVSNMVSGFAEADFAEVNNFSSSVGDEMQQSALMAMLVSLVAIVAYIWFRFQRITFGLAAVLALVHDVLVVLGGVALVSYGASQLGITVLKLEDFKINLPMIAAFMTIVGYSLNDTIVVFDRIREVRGKNPALTEQMINTSLNQTLSRTLLTSLTTWIVVAILYWFGGEGIHGFAFCLVLGVIVGTYSSIYVASPALLWLMNRGNRTKAA